MRTQFSPAVYSEWVYLYMFCLLYSVSSLDTALAVSECYGIAFVCARSPARREYYCSILALVVRISQRLFSEHERSAPAM